MEAWFPYAVRAHCSDAVAQWAQIEGKSLSTTDDLQRRYGQSNSRTQRVGVFVVWAKLLGLAINLVHYLVRR